ncbi:MAG: DUF805 domain-containing protein [Dehalococcoidia bacterium]|nr:DUF805 domain-containing protein [Dehalococcoidia bacterium]MCA9850345.1 DUF805 domain-containing protein [Dehalococcoidia bacterium]
MSFTQAVQSVLQNYANFNGRAMRSEYWWWVLFTVLGAFAVSFVELALGLGGILTLVWSLGTFLPGLSVLVRRMHDRGYSGWIVLVTLIPLLGILFLLFQWVMPGDDVTNQYGDPPVVPSPVLS